jgi:hypothetical protein
MIPDPALQMEVIQSDHHFVNTRSIENLPDAHHRRGRLNQNAHPGPASNCADKCGGFVRGTEIGEHEHFRAQFQGCLDLRLGSNMNRINPDEQIRPTQGL